MCSSVVAVIYSDTVAQIFIPLEYGTRPFHMHQEHGANQSFHAVTNLFSKIDAHEITSEDL